MNINHQDILPNFKYIFYVTMQFILPVCTMSPTVFSLLPKRKMNLKSGSLILFYQNESLEHLLTFSMNLNTL